MVESNRHIMERFTREFLPTCDAALAEEFVSPDIVMYYPGQPEQRGLDMLLALVAANREAFPDLVWTVEQMAAHGDTVAVRYTMTGTHRGAFAGVASTDKACRRAEHGVLSPGRRQDHRGACPARHAGDPSADRCRTGRIGCSGRG